MFYFKCHVQSQNNVEIGKILLIFIVLSLLSILWTLNEVSAQNTFKPLSDCKRWSTRMRSKQELQIIEQESEQNENESKKGVNLSGGVKFQIM